MTWFDTLTQFAQNSLTDREREALYVRGVTDEQIAQFRIGYVAGQLPELQGADDFLRWCKGGEKLDDHFVLPLTTTTGAIRGFQFRYVNRDRKGYQNYMPYKEEALLFGLSQAMPHVWASESIWLVEGAFDLFPIQRHFPSVVATLTAKVPDSLVQVMRRLVQTVWVGYDMDAAGKAATRQFEREFRGEFRVCPVYYPVVTAYGADRPVKDPAELWEAWGDEQVGKFIQTVLRSTNPMEFSDG